MYKCDDCDYQSENIEEFEQTEYYFVCLKCWQSKEVC